MVRSAFFQTDETKRGVPITDSGFSVQHAATISGSLSFQHCRATRSRRTSFRDDVLRGRYVNVTLNHALGITCTNLSSDNISRSSF